MIARHARCEFEGLTAASKPTLLQALGDKRMAAVLVLSFASGLPYNLTGFTVQAWLASAGLDIKTIGIFSLVGLPYIFKFLWAPLLDRYLPPLLGRRRGWILIYQIVSHPCHRRHGFLLAHKRALRARRPGGAGGLSLGVPGHRDRCVSCGHDSGQRAWTGRRCPVIRLPYGRHVGRRCAGVDCRASRLAAGLSAGGLPHGGDDYGDAMGAGTGGAGPAASDPGRCRVAPAARIVRTRKAHGGSCCWCCFTRSATRSP